MEIESNRKGKRVRRVTLLLGKRKDWQQKSVQAMVAHELSGGFI